MGNKVEKVTLELIQQADWDDIYPRALKYALSKLSFLLGSPYEGVSKTQVAHDIVTQAILKVINGDRKWDPERGSLLNFLKFSVIRSDISHLYKSVYYELSVRTSDSQEDSEIKLVSATDLSENSNKSNRFITSTSEQIINEIEIRDSILKAVEGDDELTDIVLCILDGVEKPKDIADQLSVDVADIYNAKKRLQRIYADILPRKK